MVGIPNHVIYDQDGTLAKAFNNKTWPSATLISNFNHIIKKYGNFCTTASVSSSLWSDSYMCSDALTIRRVYFTNVLNKTDYSAFYYPQYFYVAPIDNETASYSTTQQTTFNGQYGVSWPYVEKAIAWSLPFVAGDRYQVWDSY
jgi:hypothetical protein